MTQLILIKPGYLATFAVSLLLAACTYEYLLVVRVINSTGEPAVGNVRVIVITKAIKVEDLPALASDPVDSGGEVEARLCCTPKPDVWVYAFVDKNASAYWEQGEPYKAAQNPLEVNGDATLEIQFDW